MNTLNVLLQVAHQEQQNSDFAGIIYSIVFIGIVAFVIYLIVKGIKYLIKSIKKNKKKVNPIPKQTSVTEQLKNMKDLLDRGILTQSEFDEQKEKLLNN